MRRNAQLLRISSDGNEERILGGLKSLILGFFRVGKFGKYFFGWLDLTGIFWSITKQSEDLGWRPRIPGHVILRIKCNPTCFATFFRAWKFIMGFFWAGLVGSPRDSFGV